MKGTREQELVRALKSASEQIKGLLQENKRLQATEPIAVIGMGLRFPGDANQSKRFWRLLMDETDCVTEIPSNRWDVDAFYDPDGSHPGKMYTRQGAFLSEVHSFDAHFFGITPVEAVSIDPQQKLLLEVSWEAFENSGLNLAKLRGSRTGVYVGMANLDYFQAHLHSGDVSRITPYSGSGVMFSTASGRLSYFYDFQGPCMTVDTACSSSLVSVHLAMRSLAKGETDLALAGGVNLLLAPDSFIGMCQVQALASDGRCRSFDDSASGYGRGEGCGLLLLQRLSDAVRDGADILAVLKGSAVNHDGRSNGLTAPNGPSQQRVLRDALASAGLTPDQVDYVETHGTGTALGDPIEVQALAEVFREKKNGKLLLGTVKTNIGHSEASAGVAGLIKVILALRNNKLPANLHFNKPSRHIDWDNLPLEVVDSLRDWPAQGRPSVAGVSSFGLSGTNAHVIVEQAPRPCEPEMVAGGRAETHDCYLLPLSAENSNALVEMAQSYANFFENPISACLSAICATAANRSHFAHRLAVISDSVHGLQGRLASWTGTNMVPGMSCQDQNVKPTGQGVAFLFTGQGSQYPGMGRVLFETEPVFRETMERCEALLQPYMELPLCKLLYGADPNDELLNQTGQTQPLLFAFEYSLAELWKSLGIIPTAVAGHSIGEYVAATVAGVFTLETGLRLAAERGARMQALPEGGAMVAVFGKAEKVREILGDGPVGIAASNSPRHTTISGPEPLLRKALVSLEEAGISSKWLPVSHAFHSTLMEPMLAGFESVLARESLVAPRIPFYSGLTGDLLSAEITDARYWTRQLMQPVNFQGALEAMARQNHRIFLELGPSNTLSVFGKQCHSEKDFRWLSTLRKNENDRHRMLSAVGELYVHGLNPNWEKINGPADRRIGLPNYPFQRKRYWLEIAPLRPTDLPEKEEQRPLQEKREERNTEARLSESLPTPLVAKQDDQMKRKERIFAEVLEIISEVTGFSVAELNPNEKLLEMGLDSLMLLKIGHTVETKYHVKLPVNNLYGEQADAKGLATYLVDHAPALSEKAEPTPVQQKVISPPVGGVPPTAPVNFGSGSSAMISLMEQQFVQMQQMASQNMQIMADLARQQIVAFGGVVPTVEKADAPVVHPSLDQKPSPPVQTLAQPQLAASTAKDAPTVIRKPNERQVAFIEQVVSRFNRRTRTSKEMAKHDRKVLAVLNFTFSYWLQLKETKYPIVSSRSQDGHLWDVDDNRYVDITMGKGVHLFGHNPDFIVTALKQQLDEGFEIGPQSDLAGKAAQLICELAHVERVSFTNTGSEAVMVAIRLARAATGRDKVVMFAHTFHGRADVVLGMPENGQVMPAVPGTTLGSVQDLIFLDYDCPASLQWLEEHGDKLAAVLVEPVQSRNPDLQPHRFLRRLRQLTRKKGAALIVDEMITGFRALPGGAQAWFGIDADIVTYGKVAGGGMPIGIIAGKAAYLDYMDGGAWHFGDKSGPYVESIGYGSTFGRNPMTMAASHAVLSEISRLGSRPYEELNQRTEAFCDGLNYWLESNRFPLRLQHYTSLWFLGPLVRDQIPIEWELLFLLLIERGVYTWERKICFLSTAHTKEDIEFIAESIRASLLEIRAAGFPFEAEVDRKTQFIPLSSEQRRLFALCQRPGGEFPYHLPQAFRIEGPLDIDHLEDCFARVISRHEALRTGFVLIDGNPLCRVIDEPLFSVERFEAQEEELAQIEARFLRPFDLSKPPLLRVAVVLLAPNRYHLLIDTHHIAADGLSLNVIATEFMTLYQGGELAEPNYHYRSCLALETERDPARTEILRAFWRQELEGPLPRLQLPLDFPRPAHQDFKGGRVFDRIEPELTRALKGLAKQRCTSLYMLLLAVYNLLLHRLSGQTDILVGAAVSGREDRRRRDAVGMFANTIVLRNRPKDTLSFSEFLEQVKVGSLKAYDHQDYLFEELFEDLKQQKGSHSTLFDTMLSYESGDARVFDLDNLHFTGQDLHFDCAMFDFNLDIIEEESVLNLDFRFATALFSRETVTGWAAWFRQLLEEIVKTPDQPLRAFVPDDNQRVQLSGEVVALEPTCLHLLFEQQAVRTPDNAAVAFRDEQLTYDQLNRKANRLAHCLLEKGVGLETPVLIAMPRGTAMMVAVMAILKAGGTYVPVEPRWPADRLAFIIRDIGIAGILLNGKALELDLSDHDLFCLDLAEETFSHYPETNPTPRGLPTSIAYSIYTSGSTGRPKGVGVAHDSPLNLCLGMETLVYADLGPGPFRISMNAPLYFDASMQQISFLSRGFCLDIIPDEVRTDALAFLRYLSDRAIDALDCAPSHLAVLIDAGWSARGEARPRKVLCAGEAVSQDLWGRLAAIAGTDFYNIYGPTEATVNATGNLISRASDLPSIGMPLINYDIHLIDRCGSQVANGLAGELVIGGRGLARGYMARPSLTAEKFIPNPFSVQPGQRLYRTGDRARVRRDERGASLVFMARMDTQVKVRGFRIELGEIESVLEKAAGVARVACVIHQPGDGDAQVVAFVVAQADQTPESDSLRAHLKQSLPEYMIPSVFIPATGLPVNPNGKVDRAALLSLAEERLSETTSQLTLALPRNPGEELICNVFAEVLDLDAVGIHHNFFELGGHSLLVTRVLSRVRQVLDIELTPAQFFDAPTPAQLARILDAGGQKSDLPPLLPLAQNRASLSFAQQRLWFLDHLDEQKSALNMSAAFRLRGALEPTHLEQAFERLIERHESLRTIFPEENGVPVQVIKPHLACPLALQDLTNLKGDQLEEALEQRTAEHSSQPFNLAEGPLFRAELLRVRENDHILLLNMHHIISDAWSGGVLAADLGALYEAVLTDRPPELRPLPIQYADFSSWQKTWLKGQRLEQLVAWWREKLTGTPELITLPCDRPRPAIQTFRGARVPINVSESNTAALKHLAQRNDATLFMVVQAVYADFLSRYSGMTDLCVGIPVSGRDYAEIEPLIGLFINTLALRFDLSRANQRTLAQLLKSVRRTALDAWAHGEIPFEKLVDELRPNRELSYSPLFQVMLSWQGHTENPFHLSGLEVEPLDSPDQASKFDMTLILGDSGHGLQGCLEYNTDLFDRSTVARFANHLQNLMSAYATSNLDTHLSELSLFAEAERDQILHGWNQTAVAYPQDRYIHQLFEEQASARPDAIAVTFEDDELSYQSLDARADHLAHRLLALGVGPEVPVVVLLGRSAELIVSFLAILKVGGIYVPMDPEFPNARLRYVLDDTASPLLLSLAAHVENRELPDGLTILTLEEVGEPKLWKKVPLCLPKTRDQLAYIIYTSGSTGHPKGVMVPHAGIVNLALCQAKWFAIGPESKVAQMASHCFDASVVEIVTAWVSGATLCMGTRDALMPGPDLAGFCRRHGVTHLTLPPTALAAMPEEGMETVKTLITAGEACTSLLVDRFSANRTMMNVYGPTEATVSTTQSVALHPGDHPNLGEPLDNFKLYVVDAMLRPVPIGVSGELLISAPGLARGYRNLAQISAKVFIPDPFSSEPGRRLYRSGDLVRRLPDGNMDYVGRIDHQVKIRGFRIELSEIEAVLAEHEALAECAVLMDSQGVSKRLIGYVVPAQGQDVPAIQTLKDFLSQSLPFYMIPATFIVLKVLPFTVNGKLDRHALAELARHQDGVPSNDYTAPQNPREEVLCGIFATVLGLPKVGIHDNFFERGGDSILSIQVVSRARQADLDISPRHIFQHQTVALLARNAATLSRKIVREYSGAAPLSPIQQWFFSMPGPHNHFNQSILLHTPPNLDPGKLERVLQHLLAHHEALSLRFFMSETGHMQEPVSIVDAAPLIQRVDLSGMADADAAAEMQRQGDLLQASLHPSKGDLTRFALFDFGANREGRLLLIIHHLAIDGVSWRILKDDLIAAFEQLQQGQDIHLPQQSTPFRLWAARLNELAQSQEIRGEFDWWRGLAEGLHLPVVDTSLNTAGNSAELTLTLDREHTLSLIREVAGVYHTEINDILLSALALALASWKAELYSGPLLISMEGHGREDITGLSDLDISRTVGWFTSQYPVRLELEGRELGRVIRAIKEQLRQVPNKGMGYGLLRYLNHETAPLLAALPQAQIAFNYLGQFDGGEPSESWRFSTQAHGAELGPQWQRHVPLELNALIVAEQLQTSWTYAQGVYGEAEIQDLARAFNEALIALIGHCLQEQSGGHTPSDFPLYKITSDELALLEKSFPHLEDIYPLTPLQEGLLFHTLYETDSDVYFEQLHLTLEGELDVVAFQHAWQQVLDRHPALRAVPQTDRNGGMFQVVSAKVMLPWSFHEYINESKANSAEFMQRYLKEDRERGVDLNHCPLLRITLIKTAATQYEFVFSHHHVLMDGWSMPILFREALALYVSNITGCKHGLSTPSPHRQYLAWLAAQDVSEAKTFWTETLKGFSSPTPLPGARPQAKRGDEVRTFRGGLDPEQTERASQFVRKHHLTPNILVQAAWALLLARYGASQDVVFGATVSGRPADLTGVENIVGMFINTVPVRLIFNEQTRALDLLLQLRDQIAQREAYDYAPLHEIQTWSELSAGTNLFETLMVFANYPVDEELLKDELRGNLRITQSLATERVHYPLVLTAEAGTLWKFSLAYDPACFFEAQIARFADHLCHLLLLMINQPERPLLKLPILEEKEAEQLLRVVNTTHQALEYHTIHQLFEEQVNRKPEAPAVAFGDDQLFYYELNQKANQLAHSLRHKGVGTETPVLISMPRSTSMMVAVMGILKAGGTYVPMDPSWPEERRAYITKDVAAAGLLVCGGETGFYEGGFVLDLQKEDFAAFPATNPQRLGCPESLAYMIYTSGSTGTPKGVGVTHQSPPNLQLAMSNLVYADLGSEPLRITMNAPLYFDASMQQIIYLTRGYFLDIVPEEIRLNAPAFLAFLSERGVDALDCTPLHLAALIEAGWLQWEGPLPRKVLCAGDAVSQSLWDLLTVSEKTDFYNIYGPTEATINATGRRIHTAGVKPDIGTPLTNYQVYTLDAWGNLVPPGVPGELYLAGRGLARGYMGRAKLTAEIFVPNPFAIEPGQRLYRTGDRVRLLPDGDPNAGSIEFLGRVDHQVKISGFRIETREIETVLARHDQLLECAVIVDDRDEPKSLVAFLVLNPNTPELSADALRAYLTRFLPDYMIPALFLYLDSLPETSNGKLDRVALKTRLREMPKVEQRREYAEPRNPEEEKMCRLWAEVLRLERVGIHDNFFGLGGHSLIAVKIITRIRQVFQQELPIRLIFEAPTPAQLLERLDLAFDDLLDQMDEAELQAVLAEVESASGEDLDQHLERY